MALSPESPFPPPLLSSLLFLRIWGFLVTHSAYHSTRKGLSVDAYSRFCLALKRSPFWVT